jgi:antitoxin CptB
MAFRALYIRRSFMTNDDDARLKKLRLRAWRRGFREADLILGPFADKHVPTMTAAELDIFEALLDEADQDVYGWIIGTVETPAAYDCDLLNQIKSFRLQVHQGGARGG